MATVTSTRAADGFPVPGARHGFISPHWGVYEVASALSKNDIVEFFDLPGDAIVLTGFLQGDDLDTGTEALEVDVGITGNTDLFLDSGVISGDAVTNHVPTYASAANFHLPFNGLKDGPIDLAGASGDKSTVFGTVVAAAASGGTGTLYCYCTYTGPMSLD